LTGSDVETEAGNLVFNVTVNPTHGTLSGAGANLIYTPHNNYSGPDSFAFTVRDAGDGSSAALTSSAATVSITVNEAVKPLTVTLRVSPTRVKRGDTAKLKIAWTNNTDEKLRVKFKIRYEGPCDRFTLDRIGPFTIKAGARGKIKIPFHVPRRACTGVHTLTLESYVRGVLVSTTMATLTVTR
jgi:hypothetical protein